MPDRCESQTSPRCLKELVWFTLSPIPGVSAVESTGSRAMSSAWRIRFWCGSTDPICSGLVILKVPRSSAYVVTCVCGGGLWSWMHSMGSAKKIEESDIPCQSPMRMCSGSAWCCFTLNVPTRWRSIDERNGTLWHESFGRLVSKSMRMYGPPWRLCGARRGGVHWIGPGESRRCGDAEVYAIRSYMPFFFGEFCRICGR
mmetsp:Transcript_10481/g.27493  ORF Transcript_10481/g.27493 Transcript_10481/m.27493 type:complete len:200 (+) Transcript_10481:1385-1984(+)